MATYNINGYDYLDFLVEGGGSPLTATVGDRVSLPSSWSVSTDAINFAITDADANLDGDTSANEVGDDGSQSVVTTDAGGAPIPDGQVYIELAVHLTDGEGHETIAYILEVGGTMVGVITTEPIQPGVTYEITSIVEVTATNTPDYVSLESASTEWIAGNTVDGGSYNDSIASGVGNDTISGDAGADTLDGGDGEDVIIGGSGGDTITGGGGNDVIDGDAEVEFLASESLNWSAVAADDTEILTGFTQNTGEMDVTVTLIDDGATSTYWGIESSDLTYVQDDEPMSDRSTLDISGSGSGPTSTTRIEFAADGASSASDEVENVIFRVNDIDGRAGDWQDQVTITAYDALGNPVSVSITVSGNDSLSGDTVTASTATTEDHDSARGSILVEIAGPVQEINIIYATADGSLAHSIWVTDVHFDVVAAPVDGDDSISGGDGADTIDAGGGVDTIDGGDGNDYIIYGEGGATQADGDLVYGGAGDDTIDDISGSLYTYDATIYGEAGADSIYGGDGDNLIDGGTEGDTILAEAGDDSIIGGAGNDLLSGGSGFDTFSFASGSGADTIVDFDMGDADLDGFTNDQLDVSGLLDAQGNPVHASEVVVTDDGSGNALLTFPSGETIVLQGVSPSSIDQPAELHAAGVPCFTAGTRIMTPGGEVRVEELRQGDLVSTLRGPMPLLWVGRRVLCRGALDAQPELRPIRIRDGTLGNRGDLLISPQHAMRLPGQAGAGPALVRAIHLLRHSDGRVRRAMGVNRVEYLHLLLPRHALLLANGAVSESLYPGRFGLTGFDRAAKAELFGLFPQLAHVLNGAEASRLYGPTALPFFRPRPKRGPRNLLAGLSHSA